MYSSPFQPNKTRSQASDSLTPSLCKKASLSGTSYLSAAGSSGTLLLWHRKWGVLYRMKHGILIILIICIILSWLLKRLKFDFQRTRRRDYYCNAYLNSDEWKRKPYVVLKRENGVVYIAVGVPPRFTIRIKQKEIQAMEILCASANTIPVKNNSVKGILISLILLQCPIFLANLFRFSNKWTTLSVYLFRNIIREQFTLMSDVKYLIFDHRKTPQGCKGIPDRDIRFE